MDLQALFTTGDAPEAALSQAGIFASRTIIDPATRFDAVRRGYGGRPYAEVWT